MFVQAGDADEMFSAGREKCFAATNADLLNGLQTIRDKCRADDQKFFYAVCRKPLKDVFRRRCQPRVAAEAGLECDRKFSGRNVCLRDKRLHGFETLRPITRRLCRAVLFAAVGGLEAMTAGRIRFSDLPL